MAEVAVFQDQQSSGVAGTSITTTIADQPLNTEVFNNITGCSLSSNQITLPAGDYVINLIDFSSLSGSATKCYSLITNTSNTVLDSSMWSPQNDQFPNNSYFRWAANISLGTSTAIKYRAKADGTCTKLAHSQGTECYQKLIIQKL